MTTTVSARPSAKMRAVNHPSETLAAVLDRLGERPRTSAELEWLLGFVLQVCDDAILAHGRGRMHYDLEPRNVLIDSRGQVSMLDALGTVEYMAPEQAWCRRRDFDARTDVYGIGGIMYAILTRTAPHRGGSAVADLVLARAGTIRAPEDVCPERSLPPELYRIALRALSASSPSTAARRSCWLVERWRGTSSGRSQAWSTSAPPRTVRASS
jgi:serine/threonine protein kinase